MSLLSIVELILRSFEELRLTISQTFFDSIEISTLIYFTVEFGLRLLFCPDKIKFIRSPVNIIDIISILSFYIYIPLTHVPEVSKIKNIGRVFRSIIVFKSMRFIPSLRLIGGVLSKGFREISIFLAYVVISVLIFSNIMYELENEFNQDFDSIPATFWWAIITITTVI